MAYVVDAGTRWTGNTVHGFLRDWFVLLLYAAAAFACLNRAFRVRTDRLTWLLLGMGIAAYALGTLIFVLNPGSADLDAPLASDVLWLAFYPTAIVAVVLLVATRARRVPLVVWLDAAGAGLSLAAIVAGCALPVVNHPVHETRSVAVGLTLPVLDVVLITLMMWALSLARWRPHSGWVLTTIAFVLLGLGDTVLAIRGAQGSFVRGELTSTCFPLAMLALGLAATRPPPPRLDEPVVSLRLLAFPASVFLAAAALLGVYVAHPFSRVSAALAVAALVVGVIRATAIALQVRDLYETRRYARGFQDAALGMALVDWDLRWMRVNPALCTMLRLPADQLVGRSVFEVTYADDLLPLEEERAKGLVDPRRSSFDKRYVRADGAVLNVHITTSLIEDDDLGTYFYTQVQDVTDRRLAEQRQALIAELGFRALDIEDVSAYLQYAVEAITETLDISGCDLLTAGEPDRLTFVAYTGPRIEPYPSQSMAGWALTQRRAVISQDLARDERFPLHPQALGLVDRAIAVPVRARRPHVLIVASTAEREPFNSDDAHFLEAVANILTSVLDRADSDRELRRLALVDSLTGLANRATLEQHLTTTLASARRLGSEVAVLLLDLDNFKIVNDTLGHPPGDQLLCRVGDRLRSALREEDLLARLGGDEFVVVCCVVNGDPELSRLADRLLSTLNEPFSIAGQDLYVSASVGIAVSGAGSSSGADLLRDADIAMYRAKSRTGSGYEVFDADLRRRILARVELERELREALSSEGQLVLYYQPIVDLRTGAIRGFESLVRWRRPEGGMLSPDEFLPVAEESGLILPLGEQLLESACARAARWREFGDDRSYISFNLSARQLTTEIPQTIAYRLHEYGVEPSQLSVEITEHVLLRPDIAVPVLRELREMGISVSLDDFGTGYSSLSYLETYPLDAIKLDRGFVIRASQPRSAAILRAAVEMGNALGLDVIAEGIEHAEQRDMLQSLGCTIGQGYFFARPMPAADADALIAGGVAAISASLGGRASGG
jgi:diguanylate cyclase (GGDEF)-like protein/PAS domain S-box-containing protein